MSNHSSCQTIIAEIKETLVEMQHNTISGVYMEAGLTNRMGMKTGTLGRGVGSKVAEIIPSYLEQVRYETPKEANEGHLELCLKYDSLTENVIDNE